MSHFPTSRSPRGINLSRKSVSTTGLCAECLTSYIDLLCHGARRGLAMSYFPGLNPTHRVDTRCLTSQGSILHTGWIRDVLLPRAQSYTLGGCMMSYFPGLNPTHRDDTRCLTSQGSILHTGWMHDVLLSRAQSYTQGGYEMSYFPGLNPTHWVDA